MATARTTRPDSRDAGQHAAGAALIRLVLDTPGVPGEADRNPTMVVFGSRRRSGARGRFAAFQVLILLASIAVPAVALAATIPHFDVAPSHLPSTGSHTVTALVRNTATA